MNKPVGKDGTVGKALEVLDLVASQSHPLRFSELLALSDYPKASLYRFLQTLTNQGMLAYDPKMQTYAPGLRLVPGCDHAAEKLRQFPCLQDHEVAEFLIRVDDAAIQDAQYLAVRFPDVFYLVLRIAQFF